MEMEFQKIRSQSDLDQIKCWHEDLELYRMACMRDDLPTEEDYLNYLKTHSFLVYADGVGIGYVRLFITNTPGVGELSIVIALPDYRHKGIGKDIGERMIAVAHKLGLDTLLWATSDDNLASNKLAKSLGFKFYKYLPEILTINNEKHDALVWKLEVKNAV